LIDFYKFQTICLPVAQRDSFFNSSNLCLRQQDHPLPSASSTDFKEDEEESLAFRLAGGGFFDQPHLEAAPFVKLVVPKSHSRAYLAMLG